MEPVGTGRMRKLVCHAFLVTSSDDIQIYTDDPRLEAALNTAYSLVFHLQKKPVNVQVSFVIVEAPDGDKIVERVDLLESPSTTNELQDSAIPAKNATVG
jgi:hypothetical protein